MKIIVKCHFFVITSFFWETFLPFPYIGPPVWLLHYSMSRVNYYFLDMNCRSNDNCLLYLGERNAYCVPTAGESHTYIDLNGIEQSVAAIKECGCSTGWCHDHIKFITCATVSLFIQIPFHVSITFYNVITPSWKLSLWSITIHPLLL